MKRNRKLVLAALFAAFITSCSAPAERTAIPRNEEIEKKVDNLLRGMTLEEKVGQMTQITSTAIARGIEITEFGDFEMLRHEK